jgi:TRAG family protein
MLINQSLDQLFQIYGEKNKFMGNCQLQIFYTSNDNGTGEYVSKAIGNETIRLVTNKNMHSLFHKNQSSPSEQFTGKPLISTDQLRRLPLNKILIILGGKTPIMTEKIRYFTDPQFMYWSKKISLIGTESCYNIDRQYTYNNPAYTLADIEFLTGDNRTKYVPYREQLDDEWQYAEKDSEIEKMNLFERIWLINQSRISENARLKGWQYKGRKEGQLSLKMYEIEPDLDIETARYMNAKAMLKKAGYLDENGNYNKNKIKNYRYEKVDDPLQATRSLEHFIRVNDTDIAGNNGKLVLAGQKTEFITTEQILKKCLDFYLKNRHLEKAAGSTQKFDRNANEELRRKARENKARLEREKELNKVTADDEMTSASQSETVLKGERTTISEARKKATETKFEGMSQGLEESDITTTVKEHKEYVEADYKMMYGEDYMANPEYWFKVERKTQEQCEKEMMSYLGSAWNDTVAARINSFYAMYDKK